MAADVESSPEAVADLIFNQKTKAYDVVVHPGDPLVNVDTSTTR